MSQPLYIVNICYDGYDSSEVGYHLTRKGALKEIIARNYHNWELCRYIQPGSWDDLHMWISEGKLEE